MEPLGAVREGTEPWGEPKWLHSIARGRLWGWWELPGDAGGPQPAAAAAISRTERKESTHCGSPFTI